MKKMKLMKTEEQGKTMDEILLEAEADREDEQDVLYKVEEMKEEPAPGVKVVIYIDDPCKELKSHMYKGVIHKSAGGNWLTLILKNGQLISFNKRYIISIWWVDDKR